MLTSTVCAAVSAAGLGIALLTAYRKRFLAATRIAAYSLIPIGLVMTGIVDWITDLVFKPSVWAGFGVLALSAVLFMVSRTAPRRGGRKERKAVGAARREAVAPAAAAPPLAPGRTADHPKSRGKKAAGGDGEDFSDIEEILKKHGI
ncbi:hypothetical protein FHS39_004168 [Streptomyces olivoverticillatus]|uniref:Uncharacterized protein n=1 Tax=Streptomyces olivoverticillatus TaxID=66427 RepID=A0A7W7PLA8_9ACTN|nr:hypothetical protein [Streptomyces olivoverticillatus]MBB4895101.1 hypothetical protein [Streptomyces olivoverticillatus]